MPGRHADGSVTRAASLRAKTRRKEVQRMKKITVRKAGAVKLTSGAPLYIGWFC